MTRKREIATRLERAMMAYRLYWTGYDIHQIAATLECSPETVTGYLRTAARELAKHESKKVIDARELAIQQRRYLMMLSLEDYDQMNPDNVASPRDKAAYSSVRSAHIKNASIQLDAIEEMSGVRGAAKEQIVQETKTIINIRLPDGSSRSVEELSATELDVLIDDIEARIPIPERAESLHADMMPPEDL